METALSLRGVNVKVNKNFGLTDINLDIPKGTIFGLIGKNGSGKTTLINTIMHLMDLDSGEILYHDLPYHEHELKIKRKLACVFDDLYWNKQCQLKTFIKPLRYLYDDFDYEFCKKYFELFEINEKTPIAKNSTGVQKKINIILTMACKPNILLLDEPTSSLDPSSRVTVLDMLMNYIQDEDNTVLFSTHITSDLDKIADYVAMIHRGQIVFQKEKNDLIDEYVIKLGTRPTIEDICVYVEKESE